METWGRAGCGSWRGRWAWRLKYDCTTATGQNRWSSYWRMVISFWIRWHRCFSLGDTALRMILSEKGRADWFIQIDRFYVWGAHETANPKQTTTFVVKSCNVMEWLGAKSMKMSYDSLDVCRSRAVRANGSLLNCLEKGFQWPECVICLAVFQHVQDWRTIVSQSLIFDVLIRKNMTGHCLTTDNAPIYTPHVVCGFIDK